MWLFSGKVLPILVLVIIPTVVTGLSYLILEGVYSIFGYDFVIADLLYILVFAYALYPVKYSNALFFTKRGPKNAINEYRYVIKILCVITPFSVFSIISYRIFHYDITLLIVENAPFYLHILIFTLYEAFLNIGINLSYGVLAGIIWTILHIGRRDFRFYFAKACFADLRKSDKMTMAKAIIRGIKSYDKYLQRNLKIQIKDVKRIYSKIITDPETDESEVIGSISKAFESNDYLRPLKYLFKVLNVEKTEDFLIAQSLAKRIRDFAIFLATIIPVVITVVQLLVPVPD